MAHKVVCQQKKIFRIFKISGSSGTLTVVTAAKIRVNFAGEDF
jgi:hypothetical protein